MSSACVSLNNRFLSHISRFSPAQSFCECYMNSLNYGDGIYKVCLAFMLTNILAVCLGYFPVFKSVIANDLTKSITFPVQALGRLLFTLCRYN